MLPACVGSSKEADNPAEREAIIRMLLQLKQEVDYLKDVVAKAGLTRPSAPALPSPELTAKDNEADGWHMDMQGYGMPHQEVMPVDDDQDPEEQEYEIDDHQEDMSIRAANLELIEKVLRKHDGNRKAAAAELGISERTLYRKLKQIK